MKLRKLDKNFTIMVVPHNEKEPISIRIPFWFCQVACLVLILFVTGIFALTFQYREYRAMSNENSYLKEILRAQDNDMKEVAQETEEIMDKIEEIEGMSKEVADLLDLESPEINLDEAGNSS